MQDFEKLGAFYLGKRYDTDAEKLTEELVLYDSKDLTTHAVIIGMTGSGKTGLGIGILEEAALDHIPIIAIDPKGDMGNLLLTFPKLQASDFQPWVNPRAATDKGQTLEEFAASQAALWKKGLGEWGQTGERIATLRKNVELAVYTPGSNAGLPISVLQSFAAPSAELIDDVDLYRERVQATATGLLTLLGIDADPVASREHILLSRLLDHAWRDGRELDIASLIANIQNPPMTKIGVMSLDSFFPVKDRFALAMRLNNLLAAPGFEAWMQGEPLSAKSLLYTAEGKPKISVMSIAHLDDAQRMFFVSMLLNEIIGWMREQQGHAPVPRTVHTCPHCLASAHQDSKKFTHSRVSWLLSTSTPHTSHTHAFAGIHTPVVHTVHTSTRFLASEHQYSTHSTHSCVSLLPYTSTSHTSFIHAFPGFRTPVIHTLKRFLVSVHQNSTQFTNPRVSWLPNISTLHIPHTHAFPGFRTPVLHPLHSFTRFLVSEHQFSTHSTHSRVSWLSCTITPHSSLIHAFPGFRTPVLHTDHILTRFLASAHHTSTQLIQSCVSWLPDTMQYTS